MPTTSFAKVEVTSTKSTGIFIELSQIKLLEEDTITTKKVTRKTERIRLVKVLSILLD